MKTYQTTKGKLIVIGSVDPCIYIPREYREKAIKSLHNSWQKMATIVATLRMHYIWPEILSDIRNVISSCQACKKMMPEKTATQGGGLPV